MHLCFKAIRQSSVLDAAPGAKPSIEWASTRCHQSTAWPDGCTRLEAVMPMSQSYRPVEIPQQRSHNTQARKQ
jgi:hypothetical protein